MKALLCVTAALALQLCVAESRAAVLTYGKNANGTYSLYLDAQTTVFDYVKFSIKPRGYPPAFQSLNTGLSAGVPRPAGQLFTYRNRALDFDPADPDNPGIGKGWTILNPINSATEVSFEGGPSAGKISTTSEPDRRLFLANLRLPEISGIKGQISLMNEGAVVYSQQLVAPLIDLPEAPDLPEPTSLTILALGSVGFVAHSRLSRRPRARGEIRSTR
ncbi:hypothetical protein [Lacipirellula sp.]|uniref:hypothetical protein n=1 Tax=Lacipirellula sp. TaxID=2691419 RepID=UPI003D0C8AB2